MFVFPLFKNSPDALTFCYFSYRDRLTKNDIVGTTYLSLSKIAASGGEVEGKLVFPKVIYH